MLRRFVTLDVFTSRRLTGNPLAVVLDSDGLDTAAMQAIAREFNLPETVFALPPSNPGARARLRIFTPGREIPFAGHPTVGTAVLLGVLEANGATELVLEETIGPVRCEVERIDGERGRARFDVPQQPAPGDEIKDAADIAAALCLTLDDLGCDGFVPATWSAGNPVTFVPVRGLDAVGRARVDSARWEQGFPANERPIAYVFCRETVDAGHHFHARMFAPAFGVPEDAATGSAAAAFAGMLARDGRLTDGSHQFAIEQGYEMGRPSVMHLELTMRAGVLHSASVGGEAVCVIRGTIEA
ncbi:MAG: PhzF family phenazine biosynthesis isomerase [Rhizobiales bacterium]|nr:PhzF family phenazine biosynthesis isomerase [Hyphomicrobiales bacterium]